MFIHPKYFMPREKLLESVRLQITAHINPSKICFPDDPDWMPATDMDRRLVAILIHTPDERLRGKQIRVLKRICGLIQPKGGGAMGA